MRPASSTCSATRRGCRRAARAWCCASRHRMAENFGRPLLLTARVGNVSQTRGATMSIKNVLLATAATASLLLLVTAPAAIAQESSAQQKCLNLLNRDAAAVAKQQGLESVGCVKGA